MNQFKWKQTKNKIWIHGIYSLNELTLLKWNLGLKKMFLTLIKASLKSNI